MSKAFSTSSVMMVSGCSSRDIAETGQWQVPTQSSHPHPVPRMATRMCWPAC